MRIRRGAALLASTLKQFDKIAQDLDVAAHQISEDQAANRDALFAARTTFNTFKAAKDTEFTQLESAFTQAQTAAANVRKLVGA